MYVGTNFYNSIHVKDSRFGGIPSLGTQVEDLVELFFLTPPFKFGVRGLIEHLLELL